MALRYYTDVQNRTRAMLISRTQCVTRRAALSTGSIGMLGLTLPKLLAAEQAKKTLPVRAKSVIFLYQFGGPSHVDTFDMKPDAPDGIRSHYKQIDTSL